jgi:small subunit ribosomal protein S3
MGQKIHPLGFRLGITQASRANWFAHPSAYPALLQEDHWIRELVTKQFSDAGIARIDLSRRADQIKIRIRAARPSIMQRREPERFRQDLEAKLNNRFKVILEIIEISDLDSEAALVAALIAKQLEQRVAFRRAVRQGIQRARRAGVPGIKVQVSGRLNGAEIARSEWVREGRVPLQTLRANIDYATRTARTIYGVLGIKVWIFKGELLKDSVPESNMMAN